MKNKLRIYLLIAMAFLALLMISCRKKQEPCFDEDTHYLISYESNGDGTCYVSEIRTDPSYTQSFVLEIPERSPAGDIVTEIRCEPFEIHLPEYLSEKDYDEIMERLQQSLEAGLCSEFDIFCFERVYSREENQRYCAMSQILPVYRYKTFFASGQAQALKVIMTYADYTPADMTADYEYLRDAIEQSDSDKKNDED